ncbi:hypothetical protein [Sphingobacterium suaedae]|uniref:Secreted repeat protein with Y-X4-D motif n=2 Tax=Bacteria TaxID=2 RepID=A0ABW5KL58_9SPHI
MKRNTTKRLLCVSLLALATLISSCSDTDESTQPDQKTGIQIKTDSKFGRILTDSKGNTLYFFSNDTKGESTCSGACEINWPIFYDGDISTDASVDNAFVGETVRADGKKQTTYKGWPLYYFSGDQTAGTINGDGVNKIWYVAKPDYIVMLAHGQLIGADGKSYKADLTEGVENTFYMTDDLGRTLYAFAPDRSNTNTYTKPDFSNDAVWPIYQQLGGPVPTIFPADDMGSIQVYGKTQLVYRGWPLYYFGQDQQRGDTKGVSVPRPGVWPIVNQETITALQP